MSNPRQLALNALRDVRGGAFADVALDRVLRIAKVGAPDRRLVTELVYGSVRRQRTLDALIDRLGTKKAHQQPPDLRLILHLGLYQLRYLSQIPFAASVNSTVQLAKENGFSGLTGFVNGLLRQYIRLVEGKGNLETELIHPSENPAKRLGVLHSYPDWIVEVWLDQLGYTETEQLCEWLNQPPTIDLRVNPLRTTIEQVEAALNEAGVLVKRVPYLPQALRLISSAGPIQNLPGFNEGWWTVQDSSAQLVSHLLDPQPGEVVVDACAAPGGKTTHIAELMGDKGTVWACDRTASRLRKLKENAQRLQLQSIQIHVGDSRDEKFLPFAAERLLLDVPCSGLGTLHRHADARWRQTPENIYQLSLLQGELLAQTSTWVKPGGVLVYSTCTLHPLENEKVIQSFLHTHSEWKIFPPVSTCAASAFATSEGWLKVWPHKHQMDGFFMVQLMKDT